jgi:Arm DNA-binding domain/Phage integrase central domain
VVDRTALEMRHTGNRIGGSNPSLSAKHFVRVCSPTFKKPRKIAVFLILDDCSRPRVFTRKRGISARDVGRRVGSRGGECGAICRYADGAEGREGEEAGFYLQVTGDGETRIAKSWIFRFTLRGRSREMGVGSFSTFGLAEARVKAAECRKLTYDGVDPIEARKAVRTKAAMDSAAALTFKRLHEAVHQAQRSGWRNAKHAAQWNSTIKTYAEPVIGALPAQGIDTILVMKVIEPLWSKKSHARRRPDLDVRKRALTAWPSTRRCSGS